MYTIKLLCIIVLLFIQIFIYKYLDVCFTAFLFFQHFDLKEEKHFSFLKQTDKAQVLSSFGFVLSDSVFIFTATLMKHNHLKD